jgi:hypothetical protein
MRELGKLDSTMPDRTSLIIGGLGELSDCAAEHAAELESAL